MGEPRAVPLFGGTARGLCFGIQFFAGSGIICSCRIREGCPENSGNGFFWFRQVSSEGGSARSKFRPGGKMLSSVEKRIFGRWGRNFGTGGQPLFGNFPKGGQRNQISLSRTAMAVCSRLRCEMSPVRLNTAAASTSMTYSWLIFATREPPSRGMLLATTYKGTSA